MSSGTHAAPKSKDHTPRADRSQVLQTRTMPPDAVSDAPTQVIPTVVDGQEPPVRGLAGIPADQILPLVDHREHEEFPQVNPDDLARPGTPVRTWTDTRPRPTPQGGPRGVAVGVPTPESVFLDPSKIDFKTFVADWLADTAPRVQAKAETYGSNSLAQMGRLLARAQDREVPTVEALEIGAFVYANGKMERVADAVLRGELPQIDTWNDLAIYALMCMYIRTVGRWP